MLILVLKAVLSKTTQLLRKDDHLKRVKRDIFIIKPPFLLTVLRLAKHIND